MRSSTDASSALFAFASGIPAAVAVQKEAGLRRNDSGKKQHRKSEGRAVREHAGGI